jgi:hypothetical protein
MDNLNECVPGQRMVVKWTSPNNTNPVLSRQAPVHATPSLCFQIIFIHFRSSEMCIKLIGVAWKLLDASP